MRNKRIYHRENDLESRKAGETLLGGLERIRSLMEKARISRRQAIRLGASAALAAMLAPVTRFLAPSEARADQAVKTGKFIIPRLKFFVNDETPQEWGAGQIGDAILRQKLKELTNINASDEPKVVKLADFDDLCQNPYVFMTSEGHFKLPDNEEKNLREFLERGGFVHADDCVYPTAKGRIIPSDIVEGGVIKPRKRGDPNDVDRFFRDYVVLINRLFPDNPMRKIPLDNEIYHVYYDFPDGCPHMQGVKHGAYGLFEPGTGRIMTLCSPGDLHCGWMCQYWPKEKNMEAIKMGINIIIYFLSH